MRARYSMAAGAHAGAGLFVDADGRDVYTSTGPTYTAGCAWDGSVFMCIDAGHGDDRYELSSSDGPALADISSWSAFADLGGNDRYDFRGWAGRATRGAPTLFDDAAGDDAYRMGRISVTNGTIRADGAGGLFYDKAGNAPTAKSAGVKS